MMRNDLGQRRTHSSVLLCALFSSLSSVQAAELPVGMVEDPCPPPLVMPAPLRQLLAEMFIDPRRLTEADFGRLMSHPQLLELEAQNRERAARDWPGLCRYRAENARAIAAGTAPRIVFIGDSITENWALADPALFDRGVVGRGIGGQTTAQMLVRFRADVVALRPQMVHILGGTNDIAGNTGPTSAQDYKNHIMSMVEIAQANGIEPVLGSIPPALRFPWRQEIDPAPRIAELNAWLREYAAREKIEFIDYYEALASTTGELKPHLGNDGVHPNRSGYRVMRDLVEAKLLRARD